MVHSYNYFLNCCDCNRRHIVIPSHLLIHEIQTNIRRCAIEFVHLTIGDRERESKQLKSKMHAENAFFMQQASLSIFFSHADFSNNDAMVQWKNYNRKIHFFSCVVLDNSKMTWIEVKILPLFSASTDNCTLRRSSNSLLVRSIFSVVVKKRWLKMQQ